MEVQPRKRRKLRFVHGPLQNVSIIPPIEPPQSLSELAKHLPDVANDLQARLDKLNLVDGEPLRDVSDTHRKALENEVKSYKNDVAAIKEDIARLQENQEEDEFLKQMQDAISTLLPSPPQPASSPPPTPTSPCSSRHDADIFRMKEHLTLPHWTSKELVDTEIA
jgi:hypothetical protein